MPCIPIKTPLEIEQMRISCRIASKILNETVKIISEGVTTLEVDTYTASLMKKHECQSAFLGHQGFMGNICISLNEEVVHGFGKENRTISNGDVVKLDVGIQKNGWIGDNALTIQVGESKERNVDILIKKTKESLYSAISSIAPGKKVFDISEAVEDFIKPYGFGIVKEFVGHGVGKSLHEEPQIPNYRPKGDSPMLHPGMILAIEPMINLGTPEVEILEDGWTVVTKDRKISAHFEHTVLITRSGFEILTED